MAPSPLLQQTTFTPGPVYTRHLVAQTPSTPAMFCTRHSLSQHLTFCTRKSLQQGTQKHKRTKRKNTHTEKRKCANKKKQSQKKTYTNAVTPDNFYNHTKKTPTQKHKHKHRKTQTKKTQTFWVSKGFIQFFCLMAAWLNEGRCPGGRPSVSTNYITIEASVFCIEMTTVHAI